MENQSNIVTAAKEQQEKTFTQEQVNAIVGKRLAEQKQQLESEFVKREQDLSRREMSLMARELLKEKGLPENLAGILKYDNEEELAKAIELINETQGNMGNKPKLKVIPNPLPERGFDDTPIDPIAKAFKEG